MGDNLSIDNGTLKDITTAVASSTKNVQAGIMGVGLRSGETVVSQGGAPNNNVVDEMVV